MTELLGRLITILDVTGLEAFVPDPPRGAGRPPEDRRGMARAFVTKAVLGIPTTSALIDRLGADKSLRRVLWMGETHAGSFRGHVFPCFCRIRARCTPTIILADALPHPGNKSDEAMRTLSSGFGERFDPAVPLYPQGALAA